MEDEKRQRVYLSLHEGFVRQEEVQDPDTGDPMRVNVVTLPKGTVIDGVDYGGWEFQPLFVDESRYRGEHWRDIPLLADRDVWLSRDAPDADGNPMPGADGANERESARVAPAQIKEALHQSRLEWTRRHHPERLQERAEAAREASGAMARGAGAPQERGKEQ